MSQVYEQAPKIVNFIVYEDERWIESINVTTSTGASYDFTGATMQIIADETRPRTGTAALDISTSSEITLTSGNIAIDSAHTLTAGTTYELDCLITVGGKTTVFFTGFIRCLANV